MEGGEEEGVEGWEGEGGLVEVEEGRRGGGGRRAEGEGEERRVVGGGEVREEGVKEGREG